jgi:hypothetical protein
VFCYFFCFFGNDAISICMIDFYVGLDITQFLIILGIINGTAYTAGVEPGGVIVENGVH